MGLRAAAAAPAMQTWFFEAMCPEARKFKFQQRYMFDPDYPWFSQEYLTSLGSSPYVSTAVCCATAQWPCSTTCICTALRCTELRAAPGPLDRVPTMHSSSLLPLAPPPVLVCKHGRAA